MRSSFKKLIKAQIAKNPVCSNIIEDLSKTKDKFIDGNKETKRNISTEPSSLQLDKEKIVEPIILYYFDWMQGIIFNNQDIKNLIIKPIDESVEYTIFSSNLLFSISDSLKKCFIYYDDVNDIILTDAAKKVTDYVLSFSFKNNVQPYEFMIVVNSICYRLVPQRNV